MKFHCNVCKADFTTLSEKDNSKKFAFSHLILQKMRCPHCGVSNYNLVPRKKKIKSSRRGYAGWGGSDYERLHPNIIVHPQCQPHISGNLMSSDGVVCNCTKACKSFFNCWTGNVDDGDYNAPLEKTREEKLQDAQALIGKQKYERILESLRNIRTSLGKAGVRFFFNNGWNVQCGSTVYKMSDVDVDSILELKWQTPKCQVLRTLFIKRGIKPELAKSVLSCEILVRSRT